jgi:drug/metabolite transporter (DMT)-like permease
MGVMLGGLSSLLYGVADFIGGEASKRAPAAAIVLGSGMVAFPFITIAALVMGGDAGWSDWLLGALAGICGALGLVTLFAGLARGKVAAVAPAAAAFGGVIPVVVAVTLGERPSVVAWAGVALAIPAILLCSWVAERGEVPLAGLGYGLAAGIGFGAYTVLISRTAEASKLVPLIPSRAATMVMMLILAFGGVWRLGSVHTVPRGLVLANGLLDVGGNVALLTGLRAGSLALVSISASLYPAVTVAMARLVNREHLRARQVVGLTLTLVALALIALG